MKNSRDSEKMRQNATAKTTSSDLPPPPPCCFVYRLEPRGNAVNECLRPQSSSTASFIKIRYYDRGLYFSVDIFISFYHTALLRAAVCVMPRNFSSTDKRTVNVKALLFGTGFRYPSVRTSDNMHKLNLYE